MSYIAGVDIGNSTTEVCVGEVTDRGNVTFLTSASCPTTGTKGTIENVYSVKNALKLAMSRIGRETSDIDLVRLNEAAPVIGDTAMETLTETVITDSSMIGHAGAGQAVGEILLIENISRAVPGTAYILASSSEHSYEEVAAVVNQHEEVDIVGIILQADEAVLVENRIHKQVPIIDEVRRIDRLPDGVPAAIEVALPGQTIRMLSNPYGIATLLGLTAEETRTVTISLDEGADKIMAAAEDAGDIRDISGQPDTNVGNMLSRIRTGMSELDKSAEADIRITDILAVDTLAPVLISGALAGETCLEKAVGIAAMVKTQKLPMQEIAAHLTTDLGTDVKVAGVEAVMASLGALTTPGTKLPLAILDMGGGSTDAAIIDESGHVNLTHQAGAGELVSMLIQTELGLSDRHIAEEIKKYPLAKVESLFHMRMENGQMTFVDESIDPRFFGRVVLLTENGLVRIEEEIPMEKIVQVRREAKRKVFVTNAFRALKKVAPDHNLRNISTVVLVGGSAEDFEIPEMLMEAFTDYRIVCGRGNIRGTEGPRNAVATGLVLSYIGEMEG